MQLNCSQSLTSKQTSQCSKIGLGRGCGAVICCVRSQLQPDNKWLPKAEVVLRCYWRKAQRLPKSLYPIERYYACLHLLASRPKSAIEQAATLEGAGDFAKTKFRLNCWKKEDRSLHGIFYRCTAGKFYRRQVSSS